MRLSEIENDLTKENEGVWLTFSGDIEVKIANVGNEEYIKLSEKLYKPFKKALRKDTLDSKKHLAIAHKLMVETIILDWKGIDDDNDKPIPYSKEKALEIVQTKKYKKFVDWISNEALDLANFEKDEVDEDVQLIKKD